MQFASRFRDAGNICEEPTLCNTGPKIHIVCITLFEKPLNILFRALFLIRSQRRSEFKRVV